MTGAEALTKAREVLFPSFTVGSVAAALLEAQATALEDDAPDQGHADIDGGGDGQCRGWCPGCDLQATIAKLRSEAELCRAVTA